MLKHHLQQAGVACDQSLNFLTGIAGKRATTLRITRAQQSRAHHRRQCQRDQERQQNCHGQCHRKFSKKTAHYLGHKQQRNQHGDQRDRQRNQSKADLRRALERRLQRGITALKIACDIFNHHDGVVDHKASRDRQGHQRQVVNAKPD